MAEIGREGGHHSHGSPTHSVREREDEPHEPETQDSGSGL
ncbi:hypothetical protein SAMN02745121_06701 [Nannocystis exedens]|uniref:Uncharacterized protein n=2 Tax=Nannocystis exedens TaxID=54 RepID=A0A1I2FM78_9BACT|nr:hypothetical protein SAMN02745121_06701 [Nannocystis exedens]